jgi:hypothetical protein
MYVKVGFLLFAYLFSFIGAILFGIRQWRIYTTNTDDTHKDVCAIFTGLPQLPGTRKVEDELKALIELRTDKKFVGVSVGWSARDKFDDFQAAMDFRIADLDLAHSDWFDGNQSLGT